MTTLETRAVQLVVAWPAMATTAVVGNRRGAIRRTARNLVYARLSLEGVRQTGDHHAQMQKDNVGGREGGLLAAVLTSGRGEDAADAAHQCVPRPQPAGLIQEILHLRGHIAEAGGRADDDRVIVGEFGDGRERCGLIELVP